MVELIVKHINTAGPANYMTQFVKQRECLPSKSQGVVYINYGESIIVKAKARCVVVPKGILEYIDSYF